VRGALVELFVAAAESGAEFVLEFAEVTDFELDVGEFLLEPVLNGCAGLEAIVAEAKEAADFAEAEAETLNAADEGESVDVVFSVAAEATPRARGMREQAVAFIEADCVDGEADLFGNGADLHGRWLLR
jgi:hypothetical protein